MDILDLALLTKLAYLDTIESKLLPIGYKAKHLIERKDAQCWIFQKRRRFVICFRGTDSLQDFLVNINAMPVDFKCEGQKCGRVHQGYLNYYRLLKDDVFNIIDSNKMYIQNLTFIGHSLGGCVALGALESTFKYPNKVVDCYTFGAPALGNDVFCEVINARVENIKRYVYNYDIVPRLPFHQHNSPAIALSNPHDTKKINLWTPITHHNIDSYIFALKRARKNVNVTNYASHRASYSRTFIL